MGIHRKKRRDRAAGSDEDKPDLQPSDVSSNSGTQADGLGWDDGAPLALDVALSEDERSRIVEEAHREFLKSGIVIRDIFGSMAK